MCKSGHESRSRKPYEKHQSSSALHWLRISISRRLLGLRISSSFVFQCLGHFSRYTRESNGIKTNICNVSSTSGNIVRHWHRMAVSAFSVSSLSNTSFFLELDEY